MKHFSLRLNAALLLFGVCLGSLQAQEAAPGDPYPDHSNLMVFADDNGKLHPVKSVADWERRRQDILRGMQQAMGPLPSRENLPDFEIKVIETKQYDGFTRKQIEFTVAKGERLSADLYVPNAEVAEHSMPAMLALHPTGAAGKRIVAGEGKRADREYGLELAQRGYVVIAPDYPSFGSSAGYDFSSDRYVSGSIQGIFNHMRCVDLLSSGVKEVDPDRIGVIGHSLGGHNAMFVGVFDPRLKVIVSSCGWTPFHDYYGGNIKGWTSDRYMPRLRDVYDLNPNRVPFDFYEVVAALAPRPFLSNSPLHDSNFEVGGIRKAIPKAKAIYALYGAEQNLQVRYPDSEHDFPKEVREASYKFIDNALNFKK